MCEDSRGTLVLTAHCSESCFVVVGAKVDVLLSPEHQQKEKHRRLSGIRRSEENSQASSEQIGRQ
jgi:hypothetical protein